MLNSMLLIDSDLKQQEVIVDCRQGINRSQTTRCWLPILVICVEINLTQIIEIVVIQLSDMKISINCSSTGTRNSAQFSGFICATLNI